MWGDVADTPFVMGVSSHEHHKVNHFRNRVVYCTVLPLKIHVLDTDNRAICQLSPFFNWDHAADFTIKPVVNQ